MDVDADTLVKTIFKPTTGEAILALLARRAGQIVTLEDMAVAAYGDTAADAALLELS